MGNDPKYRKPNFWFLCSVRECFLYGWSFTKTMSPMLNSTSRRLESANFFIACCASIKFDFNWAKKNPSVNIACRDEGSEFCSSYLIRLGWSQPYTAMKGVIPKFSTREHLRPKACTLASKAAQVQLNTFMHSLGLTSDWGDRPSSSPRLCHSTQRGATKIYL